MDCEKARNFCIVYLNFPELIISLILVDYLRPTTLYDSLPRPLIVTYIANIIIKLDKIRIQNPRPISSEMKIKFIAIKMALAITINNGKFFLFIVYLNFINVGIFYKYLFGQIPRSCSFKVYEILETIRFQITIVMERFSNRHRIKKKLNRPNPITNSPAK